MLEPIKQLITDYEGTLRIEDWKEVQYSDLKEFSVGLIKMNNYQYKKEEMKELTRFLLDKKMGCYSRFTTLEMIVRRKTMDNISDVDKRKMIWMMIDRNLERENHEGILAQMFFGRYGFEQGKKDLENMIQIYKKRIRPEIGKIEKEGIKEKDEDEKKFLCEVRENHMQLAGTLYSLNIPEIIKKAEGTIKTHK